jgi:hypothetical protein
MGKDRTMECLNGCWNDGMILLVLSFHRSFEHSIIPSWSPFLCVVVPLCRFFVPFVRWCRCSFVSFLCVIQQCCSFVSFICVVQ